MTTTTFRIKQSAVKPLLTVTTLRG